MLTHKQALEARLRKVDAQLARYGGRRLSYDAQMEYADLCTTRQLIVDQLAEMDGALPNDRPVHGNQG